MTRPIDILMEEQARQRKLAEVQGLCHVCKQPALPNCTTEAGKREFRISGCCEKCFDAMFTEE